MNRRASNLFGTLILCLAFFSTPSLAIPMIEWNPGKLNIEQMQGAQSIHVVTVKLSDDIQGVVARVVPALQPWVTVSPTSLGDLQKGQVINLTIAVNSAPDATIGTFEGVIELRQAVAGKPQNTIAKPLPITLTITQFVSDGLPPDPGSAGKQTLLGIDSDGDGVRDDIQRYIHFTYPNEEKLKLALMEVAKQYQKLLLEADDPDAVFNNATKMARHTECLFFIKDRSSFDIHGALRAEILNTKERSLAYITYNKNLAGESTLRRSRADWKRSCTFDVDAVGGAP